MAVDFLVEEDIYDCDEELFEKRYMEDYFAPEDLKGYKAFKEIYSSIAVSYTHLDVYKRQVNADVWIRDDYIEKIVPRIGEKAGSSENIFVDKVIDAEGKAVTPGFIDIHRHCDVKPFYGTEFGACMLAQGITSTVVGNCGISMTPSSSNLNRAKEQWEFDEAVLGLAYPGIHSYQEYLQELEKKELPVNIAAMIGTGTVKISVKGFSNTPFSSLEMREASSIIEDARCV